MSDEIRRHAQSGFDKKQCLEIYYQSEKSRERKRYTAIPWSFRAPNGNLTLYVWDVEEKKMKQLRCDRIQSCALIESQPWPDGIIQQVGHPMEIGVPEIKEPEPIQLIPLEESKKEQS